MLVAAVQPSLRSLAGEQLLRKRRDAPLLSDMARETKRTRPCVALAVHHIASNDDLMAQAQAVSNYHSLVYATGCHGLPNCERLSFGAADEALPCQRTPTVSDDM